MLAHQGAMSALSLNVAIASFHPSQKSQGYKDPAIRVPQLFTAARLGRVFFIVLVFVPVVSTVGTTWLRFSQLSAANAFQDDHARDAATLKPEWQSHSGHEDGHVRSSRPMGSHLVQKSTLCTVPSRFLSSTTPPWCSRWSPLGD